MFEGHEVEWIVDQLIDEPSHYELHRALERWREIVDGRPESARRAPPPRASGSAGSSTGRVHRHISE